MHYLVTALLLIGAVGCGGTYDTQCDGSGGIDCDLVGMSICTKRFGDVAPHAFCTMPCTTDDDCGAGGVCSDWSFARGPHRVCISSSWVR